MGIRTALTTIGLAVLVSVSVATHAAHALDVPAKPTDSPVVDLTGTLSQQQRQSLTDKIITHRDQTGNEIAILMIPSLQGEPIEEYSLNVARGWGVGQKDRDSGVLLLIAKDDRRLRIEVGYGLEGALPDIRASRIINDRIRPEFRENRYYEGIDSGVDGIIAAIKGEVDPSLSSASPDDGNTIWSVVGSLWWLGILVPVWLGSILGRTKSWWLGGVLGAAGGAVVGIFAGFLFWGLAAIAAMTALGLIFDKLVSDNYKQAAHGSKDRPSWWAGGPWLGGGGPNGSSSGGFGGFGGGSFGGGGSSGSW